jgi:tyrosine decarboxylase / aspartate 1-decarboxylase
MIWKQKTNEEINQRIVAALEENVNYKYQSIIGLPASHLDEKVFSQEVDFIRDAPYLSTLVQNPNHIGCHTLGASEQFFSGTQQIEREVLAICAEDILKADSGSYDGYIASGGTEANLQAIWIYRNYFQREKGAAPHEIAILCSEDSHYSMAKAANLFLVKWCAIRVDPLTRLPNPKELERTLDMLVDNGIRYVIVVVNMMTTMFGSVDHSRLYTDALEKNGVPFVMHVDAAYGGFYYPIVHEDSELSFRNPFITSFTMDAHKMLQAPYGTGIFLIRKNWMKFAETPEASYVQGEDCTICGSRSGANAVAVWMIFAKYGYHGWFEKMSILLKRADWLAVQLTNRGVLFFRNPYANIITIAASSLMPAVAEKFGLIPDSHHTPVWYKIVIMEHVTIEKLEKFLTEV